MNPCLGNNDINIFYKYLTNANVYFEYGSGGSTYQTSIRNNIKKIYSVESDLEWKNKLEKIIDHKNFNYIYNDMDTEPKSWGHPGPNATNDQKVSYSNSILTLSNKEQKEIDLVFIDGRFRVACCLKTLRVINNDCVIIFDDFLCRPYYHIVLQYCDIIEEGIDRLVVLRKKHNIVISDELIKEYELDCR